MNPADELTLNGLKELLNYDPDTGVFSWKSKRPGRPNASGNLVAGSFTSGYREIQINGVRYRAHRLAWLWMTGSLPSVFIDHINGNKADNRFCNLREATKTQNARNEGLRKSNTTGVKGVCWSKKERKFVVHLKYGGRKNRIGCFSTLQEASEASKNAILLHHGEFGLFVNS